MKPLGDNKGVLVEEPEYFGVRSFSQQAIAAFPELSAELTQEVELLHVQMGTLASAGRAAMQRGETAFLQRLFAFLDDILSRQRLHHGIPTAAATSFLLRSDFEHSDTGEQMWQSLPRRLYDLLDSKA